MKKNYFFGAIALCGMLTLASCGNDDDPILGPNNEVAEAGEQVIVLDMQDTDVLSTKSRPLYSTDNKGSEKVTDVKLLVFQTNAAGGQAKYVKTLSVSNWDKLSTNAGYDYGRKYSLALKGEDKLPNDAGQQYTIIAVGQDESDKTAETLVPFKIGYTGQTADKWISDYWKTWIQSEPTTNFGSDKGQGFLFTESRAVAVADKQTRISEIFSGTSDPIEFTAQGGFTTTVLLKRQVAGMLGYFNMIPAEVANKAVTHVRLVASTQNTQIDLVHALSDQTDDKTNGAYKENVVNGFTASQTGNAQFMGEAENGAYTVYQIDLADWFVKGGSGEASQGAEQYWGAAAYADVEGTNILGAGTAASAWKNPLSATNSNPRVQTGSVLAGEFVIPFDRIADHSTLELQLLSGTEVVKNWAIKLDKASQSQELGDTDRIYNIYRNHLYQIGHRGAGDTPTEPGTEPDKPQQLNKDQELIIKINDQWEFIHDMELD